MREGQQKNVKTFKKENFLNEMNSLPISVLLLKVEEGFSASKPAMQVWFSVGKSKSTREAIVMLVMTIFFWNSKYKIIKKMVQSSFYNHD